MKAVLVAGGEGTRLRPLTYRTPKPLLPLCGRPIIAYQIELCRRHGIRDIIVNVHYLAESLEEYLGDGSRLGVRITYSKERTPLGTAGAVKLAEPFFDHEPMLVFNGDVLTDLDLSRLLAFHRDSGSVATLTTTEVVDPTPFGLILSDGNGRISQFLEKPSIEEALRHGSRFHINAGTYVLDPAIFADQPANENLSFERQVFPDLLAAGKPLYAFPGQAYWRDVGSPQSYLEAHRDLLAGKIAPPDHWKPWPSSGAPTAYMEDDLQVPADCVLAGGPSYIGRGVRLGRNVRLEGHCVLGDGAELGDGVVLKGAIVGARSVLGAASEISGGIVGSGCLLEPDVRLDASTVLADDSVIKRGTAIPCPSLQ